MTTLGSVIDELKRRIVDSNVDDALFNVTCMAADLLGCRNSEVFLMRDKEVDSSFVEKIEKMVERRCKNEPLQYILGEWSFLDFDVIVGPEALIPRPETEDVFEDAANLIKSNIIPVFGADFSFADVGTGTGVLGISVARKFTESRGTLVDISEKALFLANKNLKRFSGLADRVSLRQGDLLSGFDFESLNFVISNPPYIDAHDMGCLMPEVRCYEPHLALYGGEDGLDLIRKLIVQSAKVLKAGGILIFEHGHGQQEKILELFSSVDWLIPQGKNDLSGRERYVYAQKKGFLLQDA